MRGWRERLEGNPLVQVMLVGALAVALAMMLLVRAAGGPPSAPSSQATVPERAPNATTSAPAARPSAETRRTMRPAGEPGLVRLALDRMPREITRPFSRGQAVALFVSQRGGVEDRMVRDAVRALRARRAGVAVVEADLSRIGRYAELTRGAGVSRAPALVVIQPARLSGGVPTASVRHGFLSPAAVIQAVDDALYKGDEIPSYPE